MFSFNRWQEHTLGGDTFFDILDFLTSSIMLPLTGLFIALFVGWLMRPSVVLNALGDEARGVLKVWHWLLAYVCPLAILAIFVMGIYNKFF